MTRKDHDEVGIDEIKNEEFMEKAKLTAPKYCTSPDVCEHLTFGPIDSEKELKGVNVTDWCKEEGGWCDEYKECLRKAQYLNPHEIYPTRENFDEAELDETTLQRLKEQEHKDAEALTKLGTNLDEANKKAKQKYFIKQYNAYDVNSQAVVIAEVYNQKTGELMVDTLNSTRDLIFVFYGLAIENEIVNWSEEIGSLATIKHKEGGE